VEDDGRVGSTIAVPVGNLWPDSMGRDGSQSLACANVRSAGGHPKEVLCRETHTGRMNRCGGT